MSKKNLLHLLAIIMVAMLSVGFASCGDDDENVPLNPETENENVNTMQVGVPWAIGSSSSNARIVYANGCFNISDYKGGYYTPYSEIACVGKVSGLSSIKIIPGSESWGRSATVEKGYGYVIRCDISTSWNNYGYEYIRLFVVDIVKDGSGGILAVKAVWEELKI